MDDYKLLITGETPLTGDTTVSGGKNTAVAVIPAVLLCDEPCVLDNLPDIEDVRVLSDILRSLGATVTYDSASKRMTIDPRGVCTCTVPYKLTQKMRASYYLIGALLSRCGEANVGYPGGCAIGNRPFDQHIKGFEALGAEVNEGGGMIRAKGTLHGSTVFFDRPTVGGTINVMLAAAKAKGLTVLCNAAKEPHIVDLANFLNSMGGSVKGAGTDTIRIKGTPHLHESHYTAKLLEMGVSVTDMDDAIRVRPIGPHRAVNIKTQEYPGFPTDLQQPMSALLCKAQGNSMVTETIFESRFKHLNEMLRMGAHVRIAEQTAWIEGVQELHGAPVTVTDLRAGAALVIAGLMAVGTTEIYEPGLIERGYEHIERKLRHLGANIRREPV